MSEYLILIYDMSSYEHAPPEQRQMISDGHQAFAARHGAAIRGGNALQPASTATTLTPDGGSVAVTDGPYAETKEALGGYYLVEATDLDEAIAIAKDIPLIGGSVEIRPIMTIEH